MAIAELGDEDAERPEADPGDEGQLDAGSSAAPVIDPRDKNDGDDRKADPDEDERWRNPLQLRYRR